MSLAQLIPGLALPPLAAFDVVFPLSPLREIGAVAGAVVMLFGARLCWQAQHYRMTVEERVKDGELTEDQARRRMQHSAWIGPTVVFAGIAILAGALVAA